MAAGAGAWVRPFRDRWRVYYRLEPGGKLHGTVVRTPEEGETLAAELRAKITRKQRTIGDAIAAWRADGEARAARGECRPKSVRIESQRVERLCKPSEGSPLGALTANRAKDLYEELANSGAAGGTHQRCLRAAKTWANWCCERGWFKVSPFATVKALGAADDSRGVCLRIVESRKYVETAKRLAVEGDSGALASLLVLMCSLRPNEVVQLTAREVDDGGAVLWIDGVLKTKTTRRQMTIADKDLRALLVAQAKGLATNARLFGTDDPEWVTPHARRVAEAAGVPIVGCRELRRTFATLDAKRGTSLDMTAFSMGHGADGKARTATKYYLAPGAKQSGAARRVLGVLDRGKTRSTRPA